MGEGRKPVAAFLKEAVSSTSPPKEFRCKSKIHPSTCGGEDCIKINKDSVEDFKTGKATLSRKSWAEFDLKDVEYKVFGTRYGKKYDTGKREKVCGTSVHGHKVEERKIIEHTKVVHHTVIHRHYHYK